jgi:hypothetical protein
MFTPKLCRRERIGMGLSAIILFVSAALTNSQQLEKAFYAAPSVAAGEKIKSNAAPASTIAVKEKNAPEKSASLSNLPAQKIEHNKITSFFVRANDSKQIQLSILVAYKPELTQALRQLFGEKVTPLLFSVSTLPNRTAAFDPTRFCFEQRGRVWQPNHLKNALDILPVEEGGRFGGTITDSQVHQGIILLPEWFDPQSPITLRYDDFRYLARFAREQ